MGDDEEFDWIRVYVLSCEPPFMVLYIPNTTVRDLSDLNTGQIC